jgi:hypothetical protein
VRIRGVQQTLLNSEGFLAPMLDRYASDDPRVGGAPFSFNAYFSIRGREQQLIDFYGGAQVLEEAQGIESMGLTISIRPRFGH